MVRTRFAPSPTGYLHIGGVRTALFNWLFARGQGGRFVLRIDDTDQKRNVSEALEPILSGFRWLGIDWDEGPEVGGSHGPYFQSERQQLYRAAVETLLKRGHAYRDYATPDELQSEREAAQAEKRRFIYSRRWKAEDDAQAERFEAEGRQGVVRLEMPREGACRFTDLVRGDVSFDWSHEQDHVIQRADGSCLYHLASVVDDHAMEISHVIRAEEHLSNTPRQIFIGEGLGNELPAYAHLPVVAEPGSKNKLSKRKLDKYLKHQDFAKLYQHGKQIADALHLDTSPESFNPVVVAFYEEVGYLPDAIVNYLLLLGWALDDKTEIFTRQQMIDQFSLDRVNRAAASFDPQKLTSFEARYMTALQPDAKLGLALAFLEAAKLVDTPASPDQTTTVAAILTAAGDRFAVGGDILAYAYFFQPDDEIVYDEKAFEKRLRKPTEAAELLAGYRGRIADSDTFDANNLETLTAAFVEERAIKLGQIIHAVRVAVTGVAVGFGLYETLEILGKPCTLSRIDRALALL
jgi:glutamyl-tRNA synthetase